MRKKERKHLVIWLTILYDFISPVKQADLHKQRLPEPTKNNNKVAEISESFISCLAPRAQIL